MKESILKIKATNLGMEIVTFCNKYSKTGNYIISNQLLRCGTSVGANVSEAGAAQTHRDFITKLSIASKEARETIYWLKLIQSEGTTGNSCESLIANTEEVIRLLTASVKTAQQNERNRNTKH